MYCFANLFPDTSVARNYLTKENTVATFLGCGFLGVSCPFVQCECVAGQCTIPRVKCPSGQICVDTKCYEDNGDKCETDKDCDLGFFCMNGRCYYDY